MKDSNHWPWSAHHRLSKLSITKAQRLTLLAAIGWADAQGVLYPSVLNWSKAAGLTPRGLQRALRQLEKTGLVQRMYVSTGGFAKTSQYRIPILAKTTSGDSGFCSQEMTTSTPTQKSKNPDRRGTKPRPGFGGTTKNGQENTKQQPAAVDVLSQLKLDSLRDHPAATPDRLEWIRRESPTKRNPEGWATACIRDGWDIPLQITRERDRQQRERWLADLGRNKSEQQRLLHDYETLKSNGRTRQFESFGDWAWETFGRSEAQSDALQSSSPQDTRETHSASPPVEHAIFQGPRKSTRSGLSTAPTGTCSPSDLHHKVGFNGTNSRNHSSRQ